MLMLTNASSIDPPGGGRGSGSGRRTQGTRGRKKEEEGLKNGV